VRADNDVGEVERRGEERRREGRSGPAQECGSEQTTTVIYVPASLRIDVGRLETSCFFPYVSIMDGTVALSQGVFVRNRGSLPAAPAVGMPMGTPGSVLTGGAMMSGTGVSPGAGQQAGSAWRQTGYRHRTSCRTRARSGRILRAVPGRAPWAT
jgi:hypothetical protein